MVDAKLSVFLSIRPSIYYLSDDRSICLYDRPIRRFSCFSILFACSSICCLLICMPIYLPICPASHGFIQMRKWIDRWIGRSIDRQLWAIHPHWVRFVASIKFMVRFLGSAMCLCFEGARLEVRSLRGPTNRRADKRTCLVLSGKVTLHKPRIFPLAHRPCSGQIACPTSVGLPTPAKQAA